VPTFASSSTLIRPLFRSLNLPGGMHDNRLKPVGGEVSSSAPPKRWECPLLLGCSPRWFASSYEEHLESYFRGRLEATPMSALESHLFGCQACREKLSHCIASHLILHNPGSKSEGKYERSEPRFRTGADAVLQELSPWSAECRKVEIVDISKNGFGILSPKSVFPGTIVQVRLRSTVELAEVRHCSGCGEIGYRYRIALRLHEEF
jgi:hypothetical protein